MKRIIRNNIFETNSSSSHSFVLDTNYWDLNDIPRGNRKYLTPYFDEYCWGYEELNTPEKKLSYLLTAYATIRLDANYLSRDDEENITKIMGVISRIDEYITNLNYILQRNNIDVVIEHLSDSIDSYKDLDYYSPFGHIDHQSIWVGEDVLEYVENTDENLLDYLFNSTTEVIIDNDNH